MGKERPQRTVVLTRQAADGIITFSKTYHPNEAILILQGKKKGNEITVDGLVIPPFSSNGPFYSGFPMHDLPFDNSYVGTAHSHPGPSNRPSLEDLNNKPTLKKHGTHKNFNSTSCCHNLERRQRRILETSAFGRTTNFIGRIDCSCYR